MSDPLTLAELAEASGIPARTIRYYIARGLLEGPGKAGRGAAYDAAHLDRLEEIKKLQQQGRSLAEIVNAGQPMPRVPAPSPWWQYVLAEDVVVWVRAGASPWRMKQISEAVDEMHSRIGTSEDSERSPE